MFVIMQFLFNQSFVNVLGYTWLQQIQLYSDPMSNSAVDHPVDFWGAFLNAIRNLSSLSSQSAEDPLDAFFALSEK